MKNQIKWVFNKITVITLVIAFFNVVINYNVLATFYDTNAQLVNVTGQSVEDDLEAGHFKDEDVTISKELINEINNSANEANEMIITKECIELRNSRNFNLFKATEEIAELSLAKIHFN